MDEKTTVAEIKSWFYKTRTNRGWDPNLKSLAISLCLESAELLEHFQWYEDNEVVEKVKNDKKKREEIELEVGDILNYLCEFADKFKVDLSSAAKKTIRKIDKKYPAKRVRNWSDEEYWQQKKKYRQKKK